MITIDLNDVLLYLIPFVVIWFIIYKMTPKDDENKRVRIIFSLLFANLIYWAIILISQLNFKIQL